MEDKQQTTGVAEATNEATKQASTAFVFVNSEPLWEDQVQNAVKFLSHPKVRASPVTYRRSFLEKKGLTKEEIDEAFRRVPDSAPSAHTPNTILDSHVNTSNTHGTAVALTGYIASVVPLAWFRLQWYHAIIAVIVLAVSGADTLVLVKNTIIPRLKSWIRKVLLVEENIVDEIDSKPTFVEEIASAAKAAAEVAAKAADDVASASQEMLNLKNDAKRYVQEVKNFIDVQVGEMKSIRNTIQRLEGADDTTPATSSMQPYADGKSEFDSRSGADDTTPATSSMQPYADGKSEFDSRSGADDTTPATSSMQPYADGKSEFDSRSGVDDTTPATSSMQPYADGKSEFDSRTGADDTTPATSSMQPYADGKSEFDSRSVRYSSPPANVSPYAAPNLKSFTEIVGQNIINSTEPNHVSETPEYTSIADMREGWNDRIIKARVVRLWRTNWCMDSLYIEMVLLDEKNGRIHASIKGDLTHYFTYILHEGLVYSIRNVWVVPDTNELRATTNQYMINFTKITTATEIRGAIIPNSIFEFVDFDSILKNRTAGSMIDIIGHVVEPADVERILANGMGIIVLEDLNKRRVSVYIGNGVTWQISSKLQEADHSNPLILILQLCYDFYPSFVGIYAGPVTKLIVDSNLPETLNYKERILMKNDDSVRQNKRTLV